MIALDGMPGAGKTTLLRRLHDAAPGQVKIFPEAQPADHSDDLQVARDLLNEAADRITTAGQLGTAQPGLVVASDRCHIGVLAYRYALAETGRSPHRAFDDALTLCHTMGLLTPRTNVCTLVFLIDPKRSIARRAGYATDPRYALWFDRSFLAAYHEFLTRLDAWITPHPELISIEADDDLGWPQLAALLPRPLAGKLTAVLTPAAREGR
ncbi:AAA family ATPase [Dactylosporangium sp. NPDC000244]|uniref:AAA family ATPase n=1 Tax=Dactylosporangium sp. NPDC000244 TaxID=3154365 RepID=UPI00331FA372